MWWLIKKGGKSLLDYIFIYTSQALVHLKNVGGHCAEVFDVIAGAGFFYVGSCKKIIENSFHGQMLVYLPFDFEFGLMPDISCLAGLARSQ